MNAHLASTRYCDHEHLDVRRAVARLATGARTDRALAVRIFEWVRDHVPYRFGPWGVRASQTLAHGGGMCTNKSNLLVALLRAAGIPAAYGLLRVNPQEYFGSIAPPYFKPLVSTFSIHVYAAAWIGERWVRCDPSTDAELADRTAHFCRQTRLITWDGQQDALDFLQPQHVFGDQGLHATIDDLLDRPSRRADPTLFGALNDYLRFVRSSPRFASAEEMIAAHRTTLQRETIAAA